MATLSTASSYSEEMEYEYDYDLSESLSFYDWSELGPSLVVYTITFVVGVVGNVLILVAVGSHTHVKSSTVNVFLASLATADLLLILVCLPLKVAKLFSYSWTFGVFACKGLYYLQSVSGLCSVFNLTALSMERYYAIVHPLKVQYLCTLSKAKKTVMATWVAAFLLGTPIIHTQVHLEVGSRYKAYWCVRDLDHVLLWQLQELYLWLLLLLVPSVVMTAAYGTIITEVRRVGRDRSRLTHDFDSQQRREESGRRQGEDVATTTTTTLPSESGCLVRIGSVNTQAMKKLDEDTRQVVSMLIAIVVVFIACWAPLLTFNVLQAFGVFEDHLLGWPKHAKTLFSLMAYLNSCLNPLIYGFVSKHFRESFASQLRHCLTLQLVRRKSRQLCAGQNTSAIEIQTSVLVDNRASNNYTGNRRGNRMDNINKP